MYKYQHITSAAVTVTAHIILYLLHLPHHHHHHPSNPDLVRYLYCYSIIGFELQAKHRFKEAAKCFQDAMALYFRRLGQFRSAPTLSTGPKADKARTQLAELIRRQRLHSGLANMPIPLPKPQKATRSESAFPVVDPRHSPHTLKVHKWWHNDTDREEILDDYQEQLAEQRRQMRTGLHTP
jgi:hypothetical protein